MAIQKKAKETTKEEVRYNYDVKVLKAKELKEGRYLFNAKVNGVIINNMIFQEYINKEGKEGCIVNMPQVKGNEDTYYNVCFFPIAKELKASIGEQIEELLNNE